MPTGLWRHGAKPTPTATLSNGWNENDFILIAVVGIAFFVSCKKEPVPVPVPVLVSSIELPESITIAVGDKYRLEATVLPENADSKELVWLSDDPEIATCDPATGEITGIDDGEVTITATSADGGVQAKCEVTVSPLSLAGTSWKHHYDEEDGSWWEIQIDFTDTEATYTETYSNGNYTYFTGAYTYDPPAVVIICNYFVEGPFINGEPYQVNFPDIEQKGTVDGKTMDIVIMLVDGIFTQLEMQ